MTKRGDGKAAIKSAGLILEKGFQQMEFYIHKVFVVLKEAADVGDLKV